MSYATMDDLMDQDERLAREHALDPDAAPWPWYADAPIEVVEPEIIAPQGVA